MIEKEGKGLKKALILILAVAAAAAAQDWQEISADGMGNGCGRQSCRGA